VECNAHLRTPIKQDTARRVLKQEVIGIRKLTRTPIEVNTTSGSMVSPRKSSTTERRNKRKGARFARYVCVTQTE
jgi:hypothetical protein